MIGVGKILVKDEAYRFDLNAFKMLGGAYAIARLLCDEFKLDINAFDFDKLKNDITEKMTFATATDGNHGRGVAWAANKLGQNAVVYMPKGAADERVNNIRALGAECIVTDMNYDDTVRLAIKTADDNGWKVVQDTAWEGYTEIPTWIMQGYTTMAAEAVDQMKAMAVERPTTFSYRLVSAQWPAACWATSVTNTALTNCTLLLSSLTKLTVSTVLVSVKKVK